MKYLPFIILVVIFSGCSSQSGSNNNAGEYLYKNKCGGCHRAYAKEKYTAVEWEKIVSRMKTKSKLSETEEKAILEYLTK